MREIPLGRDSLTGLPFTSQRFVVTNTSQQRLGFHFKYVTLLDRWCFDLRVNDELKICGRTVVTGSNLFAPHGFGAGSFFAADITGRESKPGLQQLIDGSVRMFYMNEDERVGLETLREYVRDNAP